MEPPNLDNASIKIWVDAQLSTIVAKWLKEDFGFDANSLKFFGLRDRMMKLFFLLPGNKMQSFLQKI